MCGIVGLYRPEGVTIPPERLAAMRDAMRHRGPDDAGLWASPDGRCALGHRRLSIIDLSPAGHQPMLNEAGDVAIVFNGEIYNHAEIRPELERLGHRYRSSSDTETIIHAYEEWGLDCVHRFAGMFAFAIYDARDAARPLLHLVRDRVGIKPLYFTRTARGEWGFASEIRALLLHPEVPRSMSPIALWHYLTFIVTPAPLTLFEGIFKLPAGWRMTIDGEGKASACQYWDVCPSRRELLDPARFSFEEAQEEFLRLMRVAIKRRMVSDVPFGVLLSGGVDSSLNVALMSELMDRPVTTFSIGYEGKDDYNEFQYARRVAQAFRTDHHEVEIGRKQMEEFLPTLVEIQDEPIADNVCIPLYFLSKLVKDSGTTVVQVGEGSDENWLGYWWCEHYRQKHVDLYAPARAADRRSPAWLFRPREKLAELTSAEDRAIVARARAGQQLFWGGAACWWGELREKLTPDATPFRSAINCPVEGLATDHLAAPDSHRVVEHYLGGLDGELAEPDVLQKIPYMEHKLRLPEHLLMRVDKCTMAHAVEARVPFLDHEVVEFAARVPPEYKLKDGVGKLLVKKAAERFLDRDIVYRKKQGFGAPMEEWFQEGDFGPRCRAAFDRSAIAKAGFLDNDYFRGLLDRQIAGQGGYSFHLWTVMNAVLWYEKYIEGRVRF